MRVGGQRYVPAALPPGKRPGTHYIGGWEGSRTGLYWCGKSHPPPEFDPQTVQLVASRYIDCAIPVHIVRGMESTNCCLYKV